MIAIIALFLLVEFSIFAYNWSMSVWIDKDAVAINLAGRQRMLSQNIAKNVLLLENAGRHGSDTAAVREELRHARALFDRTLNAFLNGGETIDSRGRPVAIDPPTFAERALLRRAATVWSSWRAELNALTDADADADLTAAVASAVFYSRQLLSLMDRFTTAKEIKANRLAAHLRGAQSVGWMFGILMFCLILFYIVRRLQLGDAALYHNEQRFKHFAESSSADWFWETDAELRFTWLSPSVEHVTGVAPEWHYGKTRAEIGVPDCPHAQWRQHQEQVAARRPFQDFEYRRRGPSGVHWLRISGVPFFDSKKRFCGYRGIGTDVTELRKIEDALHASEAQSRALIEHAAIGIAMFDPEGVVVRSNRALEKILGYDSADLRRMTFTDFTHADDTALGVPLYRKMLDGDINHFHIEKRYRHKDGHTVWGQSAVSVVRDAGGRPLFTISMIEDVSQRKAAEIERDKLQLQLIDASRAAGQAEIAAGVLHNIGNVLNSLNTAVSLAGDELRQSRLSGLVKATELLESRSGDLPQFLSSDARGQRLPEYLIGVARRLSEEHLSLAEKLSSVAEHTEYIKRIVAQQRRFAHSAVVAETVSLADLVNDIVAFGIGDRDDLQLRYDYRAAPTLTLDRHKLQQILINLLSNAKDALHRDGGGERRLTIGIDADDERVQITVADTGTGIDETSRDKIFNYGFTTKTGGHGFGLHTCANLAKEMGGELSCHSDGAGQGATFTLDLPRRAADAAPLLPQKIAV